MKKIFPNLLFTLLGIIIGLAASYFWPMSNFISSNKNSNNYNLDAFNVVSSKNLLKGKIPGDQADIARADYMSDNNHLMFYYHDPSGGALRNDIFEGSVIDTVSIHEILLQKPDSLFIALGERKAIIYGRNIDKIFTTIIYGIKAGVIMNGVNDNVQDYTNPCPPCKVTR